MGVFKEEVDEYNGEVEKELLMDRRKDRRLDVLASSSTSSSSSSSSSSINVSLPANNPIIAMDVNEPDSNLCCCCCCCWWEEVGLVEYRKYFSTSREGEEGAREQGNDLA
jgi:hypothetical protein